MFAEREEEAEKEDEEEDTDDEEEEKEEPQRGGTKEREMKYKESKTHEEEEERKKRKEQEITAIYKAAPEAPKAGHRTGQSTPVKSPSPRKTELRKMREEAAKSRVDLKKQVEEELNEGLRKAEEEDEARVNAEEEKHESVEEGAERIGGKARGSSPEEWTAQGQPRAS